MGTAALNDITNPNNSVSFSDTLVGVTPPYYQNKPPYGPTAAQVSLSGVALTVAGTQQHILTVAYQGVEGVDPPGDGNYIASTSTYSIDVGYATVSLSGYDSINDVAWSYYGGPPEIYFYGSVNVPYASSAAVKKKAAPAASAESLPDPTGTIALTDSVGNYLGNCEVNSEGSCSFEFSADQLSLPSDAQGNIEYSMTATYSGDSNYAKSTYQFIQTVTCETYQTTGNDTYDYQDEFNSSGNYWYDNWQENEETTTHNCQNTQIGQSTSQIDSGSYVCSAVNYQLSCYDGYEVEADEYECHNGYHWNNWYYTGYYCASDESQKNGSKANRSLPKAKPTSQTFQLPKSRSMMQ